MAASLDEEIKRKRTAAALLNGDGTEDDTADDTDTEENLESEASGDSEDTKEPASEKPIFAPSSKQGPSYVLVPANQVGKAAAPADTSGHIDLGPPSQTAPDTSSPKATPPSFFQPMPQSGDAPEVTAPPNVQTDEETGTRYVVDPDSGQKVPYAELATEADKAAFKPGDVTLPSRTVAGAQPVRRADLVDPDPDAQYFDTTPAPGQPAPPAVRRADLVDPDPDALYVDAQGNYIQPPAGPSPEAQPTAPRPRQSQFGLTPEEYAAGYSTQPNVPGGTISTGVQADTAGADNTGVADYFRKRGEAPITSENDPRLTQVSAGGQKWNVHKEAAPYFQGFLNELATQGAPVSSSGGWNYRQKVGAKGLSEHSWAGAIDVNQTGRDEVTPEFMQWIQNHPGALQQAEQRWHIYGGERFGDLGHFEWGGVGGQPGASGATAKGTPADTGNYITGKATTFGYNDPQDSGVGAPKLGGLSTNNTDLIGVAVPQEALQSYVSAHPADWRKARVDVVGQNGQHVLVPIVDLGPRDTSPERGVVADFTQGLTNLTGNTGDQNYSFKIIPNAGPDVMKNPQEFADEQAAIRAGINTGARFQPKPAAKPSYVLAPMAPMSPAESVAADTAKQYEKQGQVDTLDNLNRNTENPGQMWKLLNQPMPGKVDPASGQPVGAVSDATRAAYADNFKQELTKYAQDFYGEKDPDKAFQRAVGDANFGTVLQDVGRSATGVIGQVDVGINKMSRDSDKNALDRFAQVLHPESDGPGRAAFIKTITDIKDPNRRAQTIGKLWANLDPQKQAAIDVNGLVNSADNLSDPVFQAGQAKNIADKDALIQKLFTPDPTLRGTIGAWATPTGQLLSNVALAGLPKILQVSAFASQIYGATRDRIKEEHPDWTDEQIASNATTSTFAQLAPQEALIAASHGIMGPILRWSDNAVMRFGIGGGVHLATGAAGGAIMQAGANVAEGQPIGQDVGQAAISGAVQAAPFAVHGAIHGAITPPEARPVAPEATTKAPLGQEPVTPPPGTGPAGGAVRGAESRTLTGAEEGTPLQPPTPLTSTSVLGPDIPDTSVPWHKPGPVVTRGTERTAFTPSELAEQASALAGRTPEELQAAAAQLTPPTDFTRQTVHLSEEAQAQPRQPVTQEAVSRRAYELYEERTKSGQPGTVADDYTQAQKELSQALSPPPATVSEAEPINSAIANRYTAERMATGELGQIDPSEGKSTEEMVQQGLQMSRDQREGLIKNFMKGKGGDLDQQGAAIRAREAILSEQARSASRAANADPTNPQLQSQAKAASDAVTAFHNGPIKKFKKVWSDSGRVLQREIPLDYTTLNGMKEAYLKGKGNGNEAPPELEPRLKKMADLVSKSADRERVAMNNFGKEIEKQTRGKTLPNDEQIRTRLMEIMKNLPCRT